MLESTVTAEGQTTLPTRVRNALSIKPGDRVRYIIHGEQSAHHKNRSSQQAERDAAL